MFVNPRCCALRKCPTTLNQKQKEHSRRDSNPQPPDSKSGALSIAPRALDATDGGPADAAARIGPLQKGGQKGGHQIPKRKIKIFAKKKIYTTTERFELPRAEPNRFLIDRLNHSAKLPWGSRPPPACPAARTARTAKNKKMPTAGIEPATFRSSV